MGIFKGSDQYSRRGEIRRKGSVISGPKKASFHILEVPPRSYQRFLVYFTILTSNDSIMVSFCTKFNFERINFPRFVDKILIHTNNPWNFQPCVWILSYLPLVTHTFVHSGTKLHFNFRKFSDSFFQCMEFNSNFRSLQFTPRNKHQPFSPLPNQLPISKARSNSILFKRSRKRKQRPLITGKVKKTLPNLILDGSMFSCNPSYHNAFGSFQIVSHTFNTLKPNGLIYFGPKKENYNTPQKREIYYILPKIDETMFFLKLLKVKPGVAPKILIYCKEYYHDFIFFNWTPKKINKKINNPHFRNLTCDPHLCTTTHPDQRRDAHQSNAYGSQTSFDPSITLNNFFFIQFVSMFFITHLLLLNDQVSFLFYFLSKKKKKILHDACFQKRCKKSYLVALFFFFFCKKKK
ncbi:hypothetical protein VP01_1800g2 [Puccinia sorghi]|uniref:Uncharacterized protein n=1 Tax=Puccinia sorghi TaxID=27349 RepID=A0A0L6VEA2_9BASI|nr:hypothetical protein VP01_1800g2 [Puccinia sorghi]